MTRLIDADALLEELDKTEWRHIKQSITNAPTVQREGWVSVPIEPYIYEVVDADDTYYTKDKPTYKGFYIVKPLYEAAPTDKE